MMLLFARSKPASYTVMNLITIINYTPHAITKYDPMPQTAPKPLITSLATCMDITLLQCLKNYAKKWNDC